MYKKICMFLLFLFLVVNIMPSSKVYAMDREKLENPYEDNEVVLIEIVFTKEAVKLAPVDKWIEKMSVEVFAGEPVDVRSRTGEYEISIYAEYGYLDDIRRLDYIENARVAQVVYPHGGNTGDAEMEELTELESESQTEPITEVETEKLPETQIGAAIEESEPETQEQNVSFWPWLAGGILGVAIYWNQKRRRRK